MSRDVPNRWCFVGELFFCSSAPHPIVSGHQWVVIQLQPRQALKGRDLGPRDE